MIDKDDYVDYVAEAEKIRGWMTRDELIWLSAAAVRSHRIVEIGSYMGRSTKVLAGYTPGVVVSVDLWRDPSSKGTFHLNLAEEIKSGKLTQITGASGDVSEKVRAALPNGKADMIFVDGSHQYEDVKKDIELYRELVAPYGLLCGHDLNNRQYRGLMRALLEVVPDYKVAVGMIWYVNIGA